MSTFKAGAGCADILFPETMFPMEGFIRVHDAPHARAVLLDAGERAAIVALELVMLPEETIDQIRSAVAETCGMKKENVLVHLTHSITTPHYPLSMPPFMKRPEGAEEIAKIHVNATLAAVRKAATHALASLRTAKMGFGSGECFVNANRDIETPAGWWIGRGADADVNRDMMVTAFLDEADKPIAHMIHYALKPCAIDNSQMEENLREVSSDVPGEACMRLEKLTGAPVLFLMGAAANQIPRETAWYDEVTESGEIRKIDKGVAYGLEIVRKLGREMADDAAGIIESIAARERPESLIVRHDCFAWRAMGRMTQKPEKQTAYALLDETKNVEVETLTLGSYALVCGKAEMNPPTERAVIAGSPFAHTRMVTMVNGGFKYMPDARSYDESRWAARSSFVARGAAERFAEKALEMLSQ